MRRLWLLRRFFTTNHDFVQFSRFFCRTADVTDSENTVSEDSAVVESASSESTAVAELPSKLNLRVDVTDAGPCRKHIAVVVAEADVNTIRDTTLDEFAAKATVPGFRVGRVPRRLVESKFKRELADELKQRVLVSSLEQLTEEYELDPINEPDMDVEAIEIPDEGDFEYSFEVEVRPNVEIPDFASLKLKRASRPVTDEDVQKYLDQMLLDYGEKTPSDSGATAGDYVSVAISFEHKGSVAREMHGLYMRVLPTLRFYDGEIEGFDKLIEGATAGDTRECELQISKEAEYVPMRGETLKVVVTVEGVQKFAPAVLDKELLDRMGVDSEEELRDRIRQVLDYQIEYRQRQSARQQLLDQITASAEWELPEELVLKQVENALHREILEMQQAGYSTREIQARENELRQRSVSVTTQAMKEHFVLDRIATDHDIEVTSEDLEMEILKMSFQSGETPRRLRARLVKTGVIENLEAQIRERKAIDLALTSASYEETPLDEELVADLNVEAVDDAICNVMFGR
ncbi:trigger factor [bacterium]|nr:trigger factor [bacterium]